MVRPAFDRGCRRTRNGQYGMGPHLPPSRRAPRGALRRVPADGRHFSGRRRYGRHLRTGGAPGLSAIGGYSRMQRERSAMKARIRIREVRTLSDDWYVQKKTTFDYQRRDGRWQTLSRETYNRGNGAAILLIDPKR